MRFIRFELSIVHHIDLKHKVKILTLFVLCLLEEESQVPIYTTSPFLVRVSSSRLFSGKHVQV